MWKARVEEKTKWKVHFYRAHQTFHLHLQPVHQNRLTIAKKEISEQILQRIKQLDEETKRLSEARSRYQGLIQESYDTIAFYEAKPS